MCINFNLTITHLHIFFFFSFTIFKINVLKPECIFTVLYIKRDGLATGSTSNEVCFEGCSKMKKISSCQKDMSKLSVSSYNSKSVTQVNSCYKMGPTLPQRDNKKLRECIFSFSDSEFRREDSGLSIHSYTKKHFILLFEFTYLTQNYIIVKCGTPGQYYSLILIFINYSYMSIFYTLNALLNLKCFSISKAYNVLGLDQTFSRQRGICQNGGKKFKKANGLNNFWHTSSFALCIKKPNLLKFGEKLNLIYLNLNRKVSYRCYNAQDLSNDDRLNYNIWKWSDNKILSKLKNEIIQEQIALVDLAKINGLYDETVRKRQIILLRSLKFRIIAVHKISKGNGVKTSGINNFSFTDDCNPNIRKCWNIVNKLSEITYNPKKYRLSTVKKVWLFKSNNKKRPIKITTIINRALQQLICLVLEPLVEFTSDSNSFGFRKHRNAKMAIGVLRELLKTLNKDYLTNSLFRQNEKRISLILHEDKWILDADIEGFFDKINHEYLLKNLFLPSCGIQLVKMLLISGISERRIFTMSNKGISQGSILSPVLVNFTLNGLENVVYKSVYPLTKSKFRCIQVKSTNVTYPFYLDIVRYADDFVRALFNFFFRYSLNMLSYHLGIKTSFWNVCGDSYILSRNKSRLRGPSCLKNSGELHYMWATK